MKLGRHDAAMLLVCLIWGANFTVTKIAFTQLSPLAFTAVRYAMGTVLLFIAVRAIEGPLRLPPPGRRWQLFWLGIFGNTLYQLGFVEGLANSTATNTALIISASPATVAIAGAVLGVERTTVRARLGIALGISGVVLIVLARARGALHVSAGDLYAVGALLCWTVYTAGLRKVDDVSPLQITFWTALTGTPGLVLAGLPELRRARWAEVGPAGWLGLAYAVVLSYIVGYLLWNRNVRAVGATRTAIYMCVTPLVAALIAWAALGEQPGPLHAAGAALIVSGVLLTRT